MDKKTAILIASDVTNRIHPHDKRLEALELLVLDLIKTVAGKPAPAASKKGVKK